MVKRFARILNPSNSHHNVKEKDKTMNYKIYFIDLIENEFQDRIINATDIIGAIKQLLAELGHDVVKVTRVDIVY